MTLDPLRFVKFFAAVKHGDQKYSNGLPYTHHLAQVEAVLRRFEPETHFDEKGRDATNGRWGNLEDLLIAAWLHDVVEDTGTKLKEIEEMFGSDIAKLVDAVTNEKG